MSLQSLFRTLRSHFLEATAEVWPKDAELAAREKAERLGRMLRRRYALLIRRRRAMEALCRRLEQLGKQETQLTPLLATRSAEIAATELEQVQDNLLRARARLERHAEEYQQRLAEVTQIKRRLARLRHQILPGPSPQS
jgi:hypothetical protein